jgi:cytochrome c5
MDRALLVLLLVALIACGQDPNGSTPYVVARPPPLGGPGAVADSDDGNGPQPLGGDGTTPLPPGDAAPTPVEAAGSPVLPGAVMPTGTAPAAGMPSAAVPTGASALGPQRSGDALRGRQLLLDNGTPDVPIMSCGVPETLVKVARLDRDWSSALKIPDRRDAELPYDVNYVTRPSGVRVLASNCLTCHASKLGGRLVIGLGDVSRDFTKADGVSGAAGLGLRLVARTVLNAEEERELTRVLRVAEVMARFPRPDTIGLNPADGLFGALATHRDPASLVWNERADPAAGPIPGRIIFSDVPPWWTTHRRERLFTTGFATGDRARIMMTGALLCVEDSQEAERIDAYYPDVRAYIESLRAPRYQDFTALPIAPERAARGAMTFRERCQGCHGGKAEEGDAPRAMVPLAELGTDAVYTEVTQAGNTLPEARTIDYFFEFFNRSWYGTYGARARLERPTTLGYPAPPLDGVWATAPYFHNGSVPTLEGVLDPARRPRRFRRQRDPDAYDFERVGWPYVEVATKGAADSDVYDTTRLGNSNAGHSFAADLSAEAQRDLLEYLKTF